MLQSHHYAVLNQLRSSKSSEERREAKRQLIDLESRGEFKKEDLFELLSHEDAVFQVYAIQAIGRQREFDGHGKLMALYRTNRNPFVLTELLSTFTALRQDKYIKVVLDKLKKAKKKKTFFKPKSPSSLDSGMDNEMLHEQLIMPSLKYLAEVGDAKIGKAIKPYLEDPDPNVRWQVLALIDQFSIPINKNFLNDFALNDKAVLVREQAAIILEKRTNPPV